MAVNTEKFLQAMYELKARGITYSMNGSRDGSDGTADCSGAIVSSLYKGGASKYSWLYNTDSMHDYLTANGYKLIAHNAEWSAQRGDIVIFGAKGNSGGDVKDSLVA